MAIIHDVFLGYISNVLSGSLNTRRPGYECDPLFALLEECRGSSMDFSVCSLSNKKRDEALKLFPRVGILGTINNYFQTRILDQFTDVETERQVIALKTGFPCLPATTCAVIMRGFGKHLTDQDILRIYASYGLAQGMKELREEFDFSDINRRVKEFSLIFSDKFKGEQFLLRYEAMHGYVQSELGKRESAIRRNGIKRNLFFHYWKRFRRYGMLGLADAGKASFRHGKIGMRNEAAIVIGKLQRPEKGNMSFVKMLESKNVKVNPSAIAKIFQRWNVSNFNSEFTDNLKRLEVGFPESPDKELVPSGNPVRYVDEFYTATLEGIENSSMPTDAPGLFILWAYLEKLGIFPILDKLGLTVPENGKGYSWLDLLMLNIGRIFYGIPSYTAACEHPEPSIPFFAGLVKLPCNDTFLDGLERKITEKEVFQIRRWLVKRAYELGIIDMRKTALDFHQIDLDVVWDRIRNFGKGPSPKKKICHNGFRPHIAWDVGKGCLIAAEFRKSSARGTTTAIPFIREYMFPDFNDMFETIYIDSEYTGKNLWQFILEEGGMKADMTACLKQNAFVKKARDKFIKSHEHSQDFWLYYDDDHVYTSKTFELKWPGKELKDGEMFELKCVVKKNINNGSLRCFGTSKMNLNSIEILHDYSNRWVVENGIKDLVASYFMDNCPGTRPHLADAHFLIVSICRILFKMISDDLHEYGKNPDGSTKTLGRMREKLFRQGPGRIFFKNNTFVIEFQNSFSISMTKMLNELFKQISREYPNGLEILGGAKLKFSLQVPYGEEHRNSFQKVPLLIPENF